MNTVFTYDYWMDTVEVTQKEYAAVTGRQPIPDSVVNGRGEEFPQSFVSWFTTPSFL